eukprot:comp7241_c0_seq1/m.2956 comp7241_c0_seq1/g.2956  ORF comp7241_c0_seq1/g.2956 comp7241_c0_seq1/m.2956 type:complete len:320 (-) comp7241_c0_seq1:447-1406(-)
MAVDLAKTQLVQFVDKYDNPAGSLAELDEEVLDYMAGMVVDAPNSATDAPDAKDLIEVLSAYGFTEVKESALQKWLGGIGAYTSQAPAETNPTTTAANKNTLENHQKNPKIDKTAQKTAGAQGASGVFTSGKSDKENHAEGEEGEGVAGKMEHVQVSPELEMLQEMFPDNDRGVIRQCFSQSGGDVELTMDRLLAMADVPGVRRPIKNDQGPKSKPAPKMNAMDSVRSLDKSAKEDILKRFALVSIDPTVDEEEKLKKPVVVDVKPYADPTPRNNKVMYRDNQVVNTRGERYSVIKREETEEEKKTYVNLKPARKYRFH